MVHNFRVLLFVLTLALCLIPPCIAAQIDTFNSTLPGPQPNSASQDLPPIAADGMLTLTITVDSALVSQYTTLALKDAANQTIDFTYVSSSPKELYVPVAPGIFTIYVHNGLNTPGSFTVVADYDQANSAATESEVNDTQVQANNVTTSSFGGSIGYKRSANETDLSDWYKIEVATDAVLQLILQTATTMVNANATYMNLYDADGERITYELVGSTTETLRYPLSPGTFYVQLFLGLGNRYGPYTITSSFESPCSQAVTESEVNDTLEQANTAHPTTVGSVGYTRRKDERDAVDYFSFTAQAGDAPFDVIFTPLSDTLKSSNGYVHCWDPQGNIIEWYYLTAEKTFHFTDLVSGIYSCRVKPEGGKYGCYIFQGFPDSGTGPPTIGSVLILLLDSN
ncbi:hypothetical protein [Desulfovibrio inopinatus]|uniref:hypothetical protein n=1 Tax=Desulfovibrio inopinatus TaxID=102109 RepID=UPI0004114A23|nr:hypothetical protein [Desulfovibrio inopinatus]